MGRYTLEQAIKHTHHLDGEVWECGVFEGDLSIYLQEYLDEIKSGRTLRLFDTFEGMPYSGAHDIHEVGSMRGDINKVIEKFSKKYGKVPDSVKLHKGVMPASFDGLGESKISIGMIDVDNYQSVKGCIEYVYPRVQNGGWVIIDDYYCPNCPGAKLAIDEYLKDKKEHLVIDNDPQNPQVYFVKGWLKDAETKFLLSLYDRHG